MRRPTRNDIAEKAGVSTATVSYVLNNRYDIKVSEKTRNRVLSVAQSLGYIPNHAARSLTTGINRIVAIWPTNIAAPFDALFLSEMQRVLSEDGYSLLNVKGDLEDEESSATFNLAQLPVDGAIIRGTSGVVKEYMSSATTGFLPIVRLTHEKCTDADTVTVELLSTSLEGVRHLVKTGCRRIVYLLNSSTDPQNDARGEAYYTVMKEAGITPEALYLEPQRHTGVYRLHAREKVSEYIERNGHPDAFFCRDDEIAVGAYRAIRDLGLETPDDVSIIGCDGIPEAQYLDVPLTTIVQPALDMCVHSWSFLRNRIQNAEHPYQYIELKSKLIFGGSTR